MQDFYSRSVGPAARSEPRAPSVLAGMHRPFLIAFGAEVLFLLGWFAIFGDDTDSISEWLGEAWWLVPLGLILVTLLVAVPLLVKRMLQRRGLPGVGTAILVVGVILLLLVDYVAFLVGVWERYERCLPPAVIEAGECELGPM